MRYYTVKALAPYVTSDTQIRDKILKHINDSDVNVRISVVSALASLVTSNTQVREQILKLLDDPDENVRYSAVSVLTSLVKSDTQVREQILKCLDDQNWQVRKTTLEALYQNALESMVIGVDTIKDFVLSEVDELYSVSNKSSEYKKIEMRKFLTGQLTEEYLLSLLENPSWMIRLDATLLLLARNEKPPREIINRIINSMDDDRGMESFPARLSAASFLINRDKYSTRAIQVCLDALEYGTGKWDYLPRSGDIRQQAALILGTLEPIRYDQKVYDQLYKSMSSDDNPEVRDTAYTALIKLARAREFKQ